jgi:hypothetical protein
LQYHVYQRFHLNHQLYDYYTNVRGIDEFFQLIIIDFIKKEITAPKRILKEMLDTYKDKTVNVNYW